jgi:type IV pilus assembly protein PilN
MYGLDINFLNDRPEYRPEPKQRRSGGGGRPESQQPLVLGLLSAVLLLGLAGGAWLFLQNQNGQLRERQAQLDAELGALKAEQAKLAQINAETKQVKDETAALVSVFNAIKPWSATFNDISARTPPRIRIWGVQELAQKDADQIEKASPSPAPSPSPGASAPVLPPPTGYVKILGTATSFNDVNDFLLVLQKSKFLKSEKTKILKAELGQPKQLQTIQLTGAPTGNVAEKDKVKLPAEVSFEIFAALTDVPASELIQELESKKATGLVTRIETLQQKGVVKP